MTSVACAIAPAATAAACDTTISVSFALVGMVRLSANARPPEKHGGHGPDGAATGSFTGKRLTTE